MQPASDLCWRVSLLGCSCACEIVGAFIRMCIIAAATSKLLLGQVFSGMDGCVHAASATTATSQLMCPIADCFTGGGAAPAGVFQHSLWRDAAAGPRSPTSSAHP